MLSHIVKRLVLAIPVIWGVVTIVFVLTRALPGDPAETMLSQSGGSPQAVEQLRAQLALDQPLYVQYGHFLWNLAHGDYQVGKAKYCSGNPGLGTRSLYSV